MQKSPFTEFMVIGHRGARGYAPENTAPSFEKGIECKANMIEFDVRLTRDGHIVIMHDAKVDRTTNGTGLVSQLTFKEIKKLDAGTWFSPKFKGTKVPTFKEAIAFIKGRARFDIEIKEDPYSNETIEKKLVGEILKNNILDEAVVISFDLSSLERIKEIEPRLRVGFLFSQDYDFERGLREILHIGGEAIHPEYLHLTPRLVSKAHSRGILVRAWNSNDKEV
ncbi:glycerophosphodiester phosphodiesterase, partial [Candidatus Aerophobetes bacterium]|nr:glycerophosphodiester phosphodiesterase [Candidatus Aerophobetes bacterium]